MLLFASILGTCALQIVGGALQHWLTPYRHTFQRAVSECSSYQRLPKETITYYQENDYPEEPECLKLVHCILIDLHAWSDLGGLVPQQLEVFLKRKCECDQFYKRNTRECLEQDLADVDPKNYTLRSYKTFKCYLKHWGTPSTERKFLRYSDRDREILFRESFEISNTPISALEEFSRGNFDIPEFVELGYTYVVRIGYYIPGFGFNKENLYIQFGDEELFGEELRQCEINVQQEVCDEKERVTRMFYQCYSNYLSVLILLGEVAGKVVEESRGPCDPVTTTEAPVDECTTVTESSCKCETTTPNTQACPE
ncbi:uncharacterized protein LOC129760747 [Uranotaenia lowii]|uniref:uncharacterized protein LOC129760747 n=1 Tax=Uranotaenia lowii TaxID=190385 RepID=UPI00247A211F|nr:uncharacterized protein LOC129760747 [Uranotaenia lowii]